MEWLNNWMTANPWVFGIITIYLLFVKMVTAIRDVIDKSPATDDGVFERFVTILKKTVAYLTFGERPKADLGAVVDTGSAKDALGVKVVAPGDKK